VWDDQKKVWLHGYNETREGLSLIKDLAFKGIFSELQGIYKISDLVIEQFTGLHGKNGKEIYKGDILKSSRQYKYLYEAGYIGAVIWRNGYSDYGYGDFGGQLTQAKACHCETIGNIHDNPELMRKDHA
jgi:uncharacterized phage protein (TIGR01671 family)